MSAGYSRISTFRDARMTGLDPEFFHAIGLMITHWKTAETFIQLGIANLMDTSHEHAQIVTAGMQARTLLSTLRHLVHHAEPERKNEFDRIYEALERALVYRNEVAHSSIIDLRINEVVVRDTRVRLTKKGLKLQEMRPISPHQLFRRALFVKVATGTLIAFLDPIFRRKMPPEYQRPAYARTHRSQRPRP